MNNKMIGLCSMCGQDYCQECTEHDGWEDFCSASCKKEWDELPENQKEK